MTITEFREEIDRRIKIAERIYRSHRRAKRNVAATAWLSRHNTLRNIKALAMHLNGEV